MDAGLRPSADFVGALLTDCAQGDSSPASERQPRISYVNKFLAGSVNFFDRSFKARLLAGKYIGGVGATDEHKICAERTQTFHGLYGRERVVGVERSQPRSVEAALKCCICDGV